MVNIFGLQVSFSLTKSDYGALGIFPACSIEPGPGKCALSNQYCRSSGVCIEMDRGCCRLQVRKSDGCGAAPQLNKPWFFMGYGLEIYLGGRGVTVDSFNEF